MPNSTQKSKQRNTTDGTEYLGNLYARWTLDGLIEIASTISQDVVDRPRLHARLPENTAKIASNFCTLLGVAPEWPDSSQRRRMYHPLFGADATVKSSARALREVAVDYCENRSNQKAQDLLDVFADRANNLRTCVDGALVTQTEKNTDAIFLNASTILKDKNIAAAYGIGYPPQGDWPLSKDSRGEGGYLIELISDALAPKISPAFDARTFILVQKIAQYGRRALDSTLLHDQGRDESAAEKAIRRTYRWTKALQDVRNSFDTTKLWRDPEYRAQLNRWARIAVPEHPSGEVDVDNANLLNLVSTTVLFKQSETANGEVCCSSEFISHCPEPEDDLTFCPFCLISIHSQL